MLMNLYIFTDEKSDQQSFHNILSIHNIKNYMILFNIYLKK